jgi:2-polyprenyl-6-methoxyphenol hydroxylase-like FAD-dependent oxidoreductase
MRHEGVAMNILIVGGGIGGMSTAIALRKNGVAVDLIDIDREWRVYGAGITITGPTLRAFKALGVYDEIAATAYVGQGIRVCDTQGNLVRELPTPIPPEAGVAGSGGTLRPTLHRILSRRVKEGGANVRLGITVESFAQDADGVDVLFSDGTSGRYDLVVGADGVFSRMRALIFPDAPKPEYTGQSAWRLNLKRPPEINCRHYFLGGPHKVGFTPVSDSEMYLFLLERTPQVFRENVELPAYLKGLLADYGGPLAAIRDGINAQSEIVFRPLEAFFLDAPWHVGRVVLIGDAAHPTTPQLASGAGIAVEDGLVLAEELLADRPIAETLDAFTARREHRCRLVVEGSIEIGRLEQERAPVEAQTAVVQRALAQLAEPI